MYKAVSKKPVKSYDIDIAILEILLLAFLIQLDLRI